MTEPQNTKYISQETLDQAIAWVHKTKIERYTYLIITKEVINGEEKITLHSRTSEPCYGGLRKYVSTHKGEATQPEPKPSDLHKPFPKGEPISVAFLFYLDPNDKPLFDLLWGEKSPWIKGFESPENLVFVKTPRHTGVILRGTDVDPTVLVNLAKITKEYLTMASTKFNTLVEEGLSDIEAMVCCTMDGYHQYRPTQPDGYVFPVKFDVKKFVRGEANDLSKGTLRNRYDYSRKHFNEIFKDMDGISLTQEIEKTEPACDGRPKVYAAAAKKVFDKYLRG